MSNVILPGATLGILGSGQLGRMFTIAARRLGYRVHVLSPDNDTPTGQVADVEINAAYDDLEAVAAFARQVDVVTFEFENVPAAATEVCDRFAPVRPGGDVLHTSQHRLREKGTLSRGGLPVTPFRPVNSLDDLRAGLRAFGYPAVLKTASWGYDGKGQLLVRSPEQVEMAWGAFDGREAILEAFVEFEREVSVVAARGLDGSFAHFGVIENAHHRHILDLSVCPAAVSARTFKDGIEIARAVFEQLDVIGVLCVEFFQKPDGSLLINELAPRPHNSGHLTIDAHVSCQFEQQVRAVCGLPLGSTEQLRPAAMANLLGDLWSGDTPRWDEACAFPSVKLHLYGKREPRPGRKMGHLTGLANTPQEAAEVARTARAALTGQEV